MDSVLDFILALFGLSAVALFITIIVFFVIMLTGGGLC